MKRNRSSETGPPFYDLPNAKTLQWHFQPIQYIMSFPSWFSQASMNMSSCSVIVFDNTVTLQHCLVATSRAEGDMFCISGIDSENMQPDYSGPYIGSFAR